MTDSEPNRTTTIRVPEATPSAAPVSDEEVLVSPADIRSTSRSCFAIIIMMLVIAVLVLVFMVWAAFIR